MESPVALRKMIGNKSKNSLKHQQKTINSGLSKASSSIKQLEIPQNQTMSGAGHIQTEVELVNRKIDKAKLSIS